MRGARREHPRQWAVTDEQRSRWTGAAPPRRAGAVWLSGVVARSLQTAGGYARRSRLARQPNSRQQNRNLFLSRPLYISFIMKTPSPIYRILITVGVILSAPGPCFAQTNGWRQLFNGKDMKGWEQVGPGKFVVEDGKLKTVGGMGMLLYPAEKFGDVVIRVVYTVKDNDCNSGVFIRIPEKPADEWV